MDGQEEGEQEQQDNREFPRRDNVFWSQTRGLLVKNLQVQRRRRTSNICNFIFPSLILVLVRVLGSLFEGTTDLPSPGEVNPNGGFAPLPFPIDVCDSNFYAVSQGLCTETLFRPQPFTVPVFDNTGVVGQVNNTACRFQEDIEQFIDACQAEPPSEGTGLMSRYSLYPMEYPQFATDELEPANRSSILDYAFQDDDDNTPDQFRPDIIQRGEKNPAAPLTDKLYGTRSVPYSSEEALHTELFDGWRRASNVFPLYYGAFAFNKVEGIDSSSQDPIDVEAVVYYNNSLNEFCEAGRCQILSGVTRLLNAIMLEVTDGNNTAFSFIRKFPLFERETNIDFIGLVLSILLGIFLHFLMPGFVSILIYERTSRVRITMEMMGLRRSVYWFGSYISLMVIFLISVLVILIVGRALNLDFFVLNTPVSYLALFFLWGNAMLSFVMFLVPFFQSPETGLIASWFYVIIVNLVGGPYLGQLYSTDAGDAIFNAVSILPSFAFLRGIYYLGAFNAGGQGVTLQEKMFGSNSLKMCGPGPLCTVYGYLAAQCFIFGVLGLYLDRVLPGVSGNREHPLFFLGRKNAVKRNENESSGMISDDVRAEEEAAQDTSTDYGIVVRGLHKDFPGKVAVNNLSLAIPRGELFGLLGHNGAGKTTTISILTGLLEASSGSAELDGRDVSGSMKDIYRAMGVCPQFDVVWSELTGEEHLYFYSRLKGFFRRDQKTVVQQSLSSVGLTEAGKRQVGRYSGGMRRRLSVAISLMGDPSVVFLDEPTTGLDPKSKHGLWDCLQAKKPGKTMILTTHSMEEAERLCDRIGIMAEGKLKCIGPPEEVKLRLGKGYRLTVSLPEENVGELSAVVAGISPEVSLQASLAGSVIYQLPRSVVLSDVFAKVEENSARLGITNFGISQSTLEDIFVDLTHEEHKSTFVDREGDVQV